MFPPIVMDFALCIQAAFFNLFVWWWWLFDRALLHLSLRNKLLNKPTHEYAFLALLKDIYFYKEPDFWSDRYY